MTATTLSMTGMIRKSPGPFTPRNLPARRRISLNAGGLIVQGKQITGTFQKCTIKSLHDDGSNLKLIASCSDGVTVSDVAFDVKISGENDMTLSSKEPVPVEMRYVRCQL
jgi:hypothetical protein